jgi:hypothetical protein
MYSSASSISCTTNLLEVDCSCISRGASNKPSLHVSLYYCAQRAEHLRVTSSSSSSTRYGKDSVCFQQTPAPNSSSLLVSLSATCMTRSLARGYYVTCQRCAGATLLYHSCIWLLNTRQSRNVTAMRYRSGQRDKSKCFRPTVL